MIDDEVRQMLERRAGDVTPSPDAWAAIERRLDQDVARIVPMPLRPSRRSSPLLVAAAVVMALGVAALVVTRPDGTSRVDTNRAGPAGLAGPPTTAGGTNPELAPVWPATSVAGLEALQADADAGRRPDLLDPRAAAGQYLSDRFLAAAGRPVELETLAYRAGDNRSGEVPYRAGGLPGTVLVRRLAGEGSIWYVVGLTSLRLTVEGAGYDGGRFTAGIRATAPGRLEVEVRRADGGEPARSVQDVAAGQVVEVDEALPDGRAAIAQLRHTGADGVVSLAEVRVPAGPSPVRPAYCEVLDSVSGERPEPYVGSDEHLADLLRLIDAAPTEAAADLGAYRDFVAERVSPGDPASQLPENWPPAVREAIQRIDAHDARLCRGG